MADRNLMNLSMLEDELKQEMAAEEVAHGGKMATLKRRLSMIENAREALRQLLDAIPDHD